MTAGRVLCDVSVTLLKSCFLPSGTSRNGEEQPGTFWDWPWAFWAASLEDSPPVPAGDVQRWAIPEVPCPLPPGARPKGRLSPVPSRRTAGHA